MDAQSKYYYESVARIKFVLINIQICQKCVKFMSAYAGMGIIGLVNFYSVLNVAHYISILQGKH